MGYSVHQCFKHYAVLKKLLAFASPLPPDEWRRTDFVLKLCQNADKVIR